MANSKAWDQAFLANSKGSAATRDRAFRTWHAIGKFAAEKKWGLTPEAITPKQMRQFLEHRAESVTARSVQLEASHLRRAISGAGRQLDDVRDPKNSWSSARMGVPSASRIGGKAAADPEKYAASKEQMPADVRAAIGLVEAFGLRQKEAVMAGDSLKEWARELAKPDSKERGAYIQVIDGTKGGRPRYTFIQPEQIEAASKAVQDAQNSPAAKGSVIDSANLKDALKRYSNCLYRLGFRGDDSGHGLRRAFAQKQYVYYRETGLDERLALKRLSQDLGHGDGRGTWVKNNYLMGGSA